MTWRDRYHEAHRLNCQREYPNVWKDGHYAPLQSKNMPDVTTHSGMIKFMVNFIQWSGWYAYSHNVVQRVSDKVVTEASGNKFTDKRYTKSSRKGIADVQGTIRGRKIQLDAKIGRDTPRKAQLEQQAKERAAGGIYEFIHTPEEFFSLYDFIVNLASNG